MAIKLKPVDQIAAKFTQRAAGSGQAYTDGVNSPRRPQNQAAKDAVTSWIAGTSQALANNGARWTKGLDAAGEAKWQQAAANKGAQRYTVGVQDAGAAYAKGFQPFAQALSTLTLGPRGPKGDNANLQRVAQVVQTLRAVKVGA